MHSILGTVLTAAYLLNRRLTKILKGFPLKEAWLTSKASVSSLSVFGSTCYKHVLDKLMKKIDDKGGQINIVGYHDTRDYKLFSIMTKQVVISIYVIVVELKIEIRTRKKSLLVCYLI
jgi:hypothetical protein